MQPCTSGRLCAPPHSITPYPVRCEPGSMPRMRTFAAGATRTDTGRTTTAAPPDATAPDARAPGSNARQDLVRYLGIRIHVLHVIEVFEHLEEAHHGFRGRALQRRRNRGPLSDFGIRRREAVRDELHAHGFEVERIGEDFERPV